MRQQLDFETRMQRLLACHETVGQLLTCNDQFGDISHEDIFYWPGAVTGIARTIAEARHKVQEDIKYNIACHARREYGVRGFGTSDLRQDNPETITSRADILAMMTAPLTPELRQERSARISSVLTAFATGQTIRAARHDRFGKPQGQPTEVAADIGRALFAQFRNGHISSQILTIHYDSSHSIPPDDNAADPRHSKLGTPIIDINLPTLVAGEQGIYIPERWI
jgi:hypothetical protein